jgi:hypothetical protein
LFILTSCDLMQIWLPRNASARAPGSWSLPAFYGPLQYPDTVGRMQTTRFVRRECILPLCRWHATLYTKETAIAVLAHDTRESPRLLSCLSLVEVVMRWRKKLISGKLLFVTAVLLACGGAAPVALAGEFMFMPTAAVVQEEGSTDDPTLEKRQLIGDFFYSGDHGRLRLLSEFQIDRESADMERLQAGWRFTPEVSVWFGRFHNPIGYWNMEHHHGHYMETSAERPRILEFEDEGGPLPIHLMGFLLQGLHPMGTGSVQYELGLATGPRVIDEGLSSRLNGNYTAVFPRLPRERQIVGMRWDFRDNQALKLEGIRDTVVAGTTFNGFEIQWSGMFH